MDAELPQWPATEQLRTQYAQHLLEELDHFNPGQLVVMLSDGLIAIDRSGFVEFKGTPIIAPHNPYKPPARLYACQLVKLAVSILQDPADPLDAVLQSYNASCDRQLDASKRLFWSDVFRETADYVAAPEAVEIARSILHDPTRLFVERARILMLRHWTAAVADHAVGLLTKTPWIVPKGSEFDLAVKRALESFKAAPAELQKPQGVLRHVVNTRALAEEYASERDPDIVVYDPDATLPVRPTLLMLAKRDHIVLALKLLLDTSLGKPIVATAQDEKRLPEGTPGCFAECCCYLHDHRRRP